MLPPSLICSMIFVIVNPWAFYMSISVVCFQNIKSWVHIANPDVLAISKTWLKKGVSVLEIRIPGYNVFRQDRATKGGSVAIFVKDHLQCFMLYKVPKQFELLLLKLSTNFTLSVAVCYRPPSAPACTLRALGELLAPHNTATLIGILTNTQSNYRSGVKI